jgi:hypothetical protein
MYKSEFIIKSVLAMNQSGDVDPLSRVQLALKQLEEMESSGVMFSETEEEAIFEENISGGTLA